MKYVALLSGGKDSCFNLLHCQKNGHDLVAAASLRPEPGKDEIDSYMYQTVGQDAIELVAKALDVPLYRKVISGSAVHQGAEYGPRTAHGLADLEGDETEDLYHLLSTVLEHHPGIQGVSVGAILSNYQRVRVEHVCRRLGLTTLAYLWQRDQGELLSEMIQANLTAVLIKVAGIGLTVKHLGKTLQEMHPTLIKLNTLYGSHICGEGGEYETLTIDSPMFKSRICLKQVETVIHADNDFATVAYLRVRDAELVPKDANLSPELPVPDLLEQPFVDISESAASMTSSAHSVLPGSFEGERQHCNAFATSSRKVGDWVAVCNVQRKLAPNLDITIEEEVIECFQTLASELKKYGLGIVHCANINVFLSSMDFFAKVNTVYGTFFGTSPPARACVAVSLPEGIRVRLDVIAYTERQTRDRHALHVQGLSYWAPANIGPYSQAILAQEWVFVSGQIALLPSSLTLVKPLPLQAALASQHADRVVKALAANTGSNWQGIPHLNIFWFCGVDDLLAMKPIQHRLKEDNIPSIFVVVAGLPKEAQIERQTLYHTGRSECQSDEGISEKLHQVICTELKRSGDTLLLYQQCVLGAYGVSLICVKGELDIDVASGYAASHQQEPVLSTRFFYSSSLASSSKRLDVATKLGLANVPITEIPCLFISSGMEDGWDFAACILSHTAS